jgi:hypothetical protein
MIIVQLVGEATIIQSLITNLTLDMQLYTHRSLEARIGRF